MMDPEWVPTDVDFGTEQYWSEVNDCYGPSTTTPRTLKRLFAPDQATRDRAVYWLYAALFHQGGRFEATIRAAPLLIDIAVYPALPAWSRRFLCEYITALAYGFAGELPYRGVNPPERLALLKEATKQGVWKQTDEAGLRIEPYCDKWTAHDLYRVILDHRTRLYSLIEYDDASVAAAARTALSLLAADDVTFRYRMEKLLAKAGDEFSAGREPADPEPAVSLLVGIATMARATKTPKPCALITPWLDAAQLRLRFAAAVALAEPISIGAFRAQLIEGLTTPTVRGECPPLDQVWTSLEALAMSIVHEGLSGAQNCEKEAWLDGFVANLDAQDIDRALKAAELVLNMLSPSCKKEFKDFPAVTLTKLQRRGLEAIRDRGLWSLSGDGEDQSTLLNFRQIVASFGLPDSRKELAEYLAGHD